MRTSARRLALAWLLAAGIPAAMATTPAAPLSPVPKPVLAEAREGSFVLRPGTPIVADAAEPAAAGVARYLAARLESARGMQLPVFVRERVGTQDNIVLRIDPRLAVAGEEAYVLDIGAHGVVVAARSAHGLFNGAISLLQLATAAAQPERDAVPLHAVHIEDAPRFAWRGLMLDSARHMQSVPEIEAFLDAMALHKLDVMQWHLTDDQGWRLQIRKYPKLSEVGAWRIDAGAAGIGADGKPVRYGGYYTQDEVRHVVAYAAARYITVVPEIDLPGHAQAAVAAYPEFGSVDHAPPVSPDWGVHEYLFNVEEPTLRFLQDVLTETMELFPSQFIHVGGDEAVKSQWKNSPRVQARMKELGIADETRLQAWLTGQMQEFLAAHGRRLIGWDEILEGGLPADAAVMSWRGTEGAIAATKAGHDSVLSPWPLLYFDNRQGTGAEEPPGRLRVVSLEDVYRFDPLPSSMDAAQASHLLGVQGNVWTAHIRTAERVDWMSFPRAAAIAEMGWTAPAARRWEDFLQRLPGLYASYDALGVRHADSPFAVLAKTSYAPAGAATVSLSTQTGAAQVRYTLDGSEPGPDSRLYSHPLSLEVPASLKAASFAGAQRLSSTLELPLRRELAQARRAGELKLCTENIALGLEDDGPAQGPRTYFPIDIQNPCWIFEGADLDAAVQLEARVGSVPFNFQIGDLKDKIVFATPRTPQGELVVLLDTCGGEELARLPLAPAAANAGVTTLPAAALKRVGGRHDLCLRFAQPALEPMWALDAVQLIDSKR